MARKTILWVVLTWDIKKILRIWQRFLMFYSYHYVNYMEILLQPFILERAYKKYGKREGLSPLHISFTNLNRMLFFTLIFISFIVNSHISMWYYTKMDQNWNKKFLQTLYVSNRKKNQNPKTSKFRQTNKTQNDFCLQKLKHSTRSGQIRDLTFSLPMKMLLTSFWKSCVCMWQIVRGVGVM